MSLHHEPVYTVGASAVRVDLGGGVFQGDLGIVAIDEIVDPDLQPIPRVGKSIKIAGAKSHIGHNALVTFDFARQQVAYLSIKGVPGTVGRTQVVALAIIKAVKRTIGIQGTIAGRSIVKDIGSKVAHIHTYRSSVLYPHSTIAMAKKPGSYVKYLLLAQVRAYTIRQLFRFLVGQLYLKVAGKCQACVIAQNPAA